MCKGQSKTWGNEIVVTEAKLDDVKRFLKQNDRCLKYSSHEVNKIYFELHST